MKRLSIRRRDVGSYEVGPTGHGPTAMVSGYNRKDALKRGKAALRLNGQLALAAEKSFRDNDGINTRRVAQPQAPVDSR